MRRPWPILAGLGVCVTLLLVSVLLARGLDLAPVSAPGPAPRTAASPTAGRSRSSPTGRTCPMATRPPGSGGAPIACRSR